MKIRHLLSTLFLCIVAVFPGGPSQDAADAQSNPLTVNYRLVGSSQAGTTLTQTVEFQITNTAAHAVTNVVAAVLLASSTEQRVDTVGLEQLSPGQILLLSHDFTGAADFITEAFSSGSLTLAIDYDDADGIHHRIVVSVVQVT